MERELWEESFGTRSTCKEDFFDSTQTKITGYFRWLEKGGKSEFVGISRINLEHLLDKSTPEISEVTQGIYVPLRTMYMLKEELKKLVHEEETEDGKKEEEKTENRKEDEEKTENRKEDEEKKETKDKKKDTKKEGVYISEECSISCAVAILSLSSLCDEICDNCELKKRGECNANSCTTDPCYTLFR